VSTCKTGVYVIICVPTGKRYVGSAARSFKDRWDQHLHDLRAGRHHSDYLQKAWDKYGESNFEFKVAEYCLPEHAVAQEQVYLDYYRSYERDKGFNICVIAGSRKGSKISEEGRRRIAEAVRRRVVSDETKRRISEAKMGHSFTPEQRKRLSEGQKRRPPQSEETRRKKSESSRGRKRSPEAVAKTAAANRGKKRTDEYCERVRQRQTGRVVSPETRAKMSAARKGYKMSDESRAKVSAARQAYEARKAAENVKPD